MTDITKQKELESKILDEEEKFRVIIKFITNKNTFFDFLNETANLYHFSKDVFKNCSIDNDKLIELKRIVHTIKGNSGLFELRKIQDICQKLEDEIFKIKDEIIESDIKENCNKLLDRFHNEIEENLDYFSATLGEDVRNANQFLNIPISKLIELEDYIISNYEKTEIEDILIKIKNLRKLPVIDLFKIYPEMSLDLAKTKSKSIKPFSITGGDILIQKEIYSELASTFVHLFRNAIDHGIETEDERLNLNKERSGNLNFSILEVAGNLQFILKDDGRGINKDKIKKKILENKLLNEAELNKLSETELLNFIFHPQFSTAETVTETSGRGVGLTAFKEAVDNLKGTITINTELNAGTTIIINVPKK